MPYKPETQDDLDLLSYQGVLAKKAVCGKLLGKKARLDFTFHVTEDDPRGGYVCVTVVQNREDVCRYMWRIDAAERTELKDQKAPGKSKRLQYITMAKDMFWGACAEWVEHGQVTEYPQVPFCKSLRGQELTEIADQYQ